MKECTWRGGCAVTIGSDEVFCSYHSKVTDGMIQTTRSDGFAIIPVDLTLRERAEADHRRADYLASLIADDRERCEKRRQERARAAEVRIWADGASSA